MFPTEGWESNRQSGEELATHDGSHVRTSDESQAMNGGDRDRVGVSFRRPSASRGSLSRWPFESVSS